MNNAVCITDSTFGLTHGKSTLVTDINRMELSALTMASRPFARISLGLLQAVLVTALFAAVQAFMVFPQFGDIIKNWTDWSYFKEPLDAIVNLVKVGFGAATFFLLPLAGALWVADKAVHPLRLHFSTPITKTIPLDKVSSLSLTEKGELKVCFAELGIPFNQETLSGL